MKSASIAILAAALLAVPAGAQDQTADRAKQIATQPARDVGAERTEIPEVLQQATAAPYSLQGLRNCAQLRTAIRNLTDVLGTDFAVGQEVNENRASKIAEAGGRTIVNSLIPFRGLVREVSGAAPAERRLNAAMDTGYARRGFLRGVYTQRGCRPAL